MMTRRQVLNFVLHVVFGQQEEDDHVSLREMTFKAIIDWLLSNPDIHFKEITFKSSETSSSSLDPSVIISVKSSSPDVTDDGHHRHLPRESSLPDVVSSSKHESLVRIGRHLRNISVSFSRRFFNTL